MSETIEVPKGLDKLDASEQALFESMRADDDGAPSPEPSAAPPAPAASAEPPLAPEPAADDDTLEIELEAPPPADDGRTRTVPHAQFHAANERRKAAEAKVAAAEAKAAETQATLERERAVLQARVDMITGLAAVQPPAPVEVPPAAPAPIEIPDVATDPIGHFKAIAEQTQRRLAEEQTARENLGAIVRGLQENQQRAAQVAELRNWGMAQEAAFQRQEPTYMAAMDHLKDSRRKELSLIGVTNQAEQERIIANDVQAIAIRAKNEGANFAERLFNTAVARGFQKAPAAAPAATIPPLEAEPAAAPAARAAASQQARDNATTLSMVGSAPPPRLSVAKIADMNETQFAALYERLKDNPTALRDLMGH